MLAQFFGAKHPLTSGGSQAAVEDVEFSVFQHFGPDHGKNVECVRARLRSGSDEAKLQHLLKILQHLHDANPASASELFSRAGKLGYGEFIGRNIATGLTSCLETMISTMNRGMDELRAGQNMVYVLMFNLASLLRQLAQLPGTTKYRDILSHWISIVRSGVSEDFAGCLRPLEDLSRIALFYLKNAFELGQDFFLLVVKMNEGLKDKRKVKLTSLAVALAAAISNGSTPAQFSAEVGEFWEVFEAQDWELIKLEAMIAMKEALTHFRFPRSADLVQPIFDGIVLILQQNHTLSLRNRLGDYKQVHVLPAEVVAEHSRLIRGAEGLCNNLYQMPLASSNAKQQSEQYVGGLVMHKIIPMLEEFQCFCQLFMSSQQQIMAMQQQLVHNVPASSSTPHGLPEASARSNVPGGDQEFGANMDLFPPASSKPPGVLTSPSPLASPGAVSIGILPTPSTPPAGVPHQTHQRQLASLPQSVPGSTTVQPGIQTRYQFLESRPAQASAARVSSPKSVMDTEQWRYS